MEHKETIERAANLNCLLKCLCAVDSDNVEAVQAIPQALEIAREYAETLFEAIVNMD